MDVVVTGAAGFIGAATARALLARGERVVGIDSLNEYYDPKLKQARLDALQRDFGQSFRFLHLDIADAAALDEAVAGLKFDRMVHLAAQAGVRYSRDNPAAYVHANLVGHANMLELVRARQPSHFVYASTSAVYGSNRNLPFRVEDRSDQPLSFYGATKKANELMSESYASLYGLAMTGLRFFSVYGPWDRPDRAMWIFTSAMYEGRPLPLFNGGEMRRDFTYIDDVVRAVLACLDAPPRDDDLMKAGGSTSPHAIYNVGNSRSEDLMRVVELLEQSTGMTALLSPEPLQAGEVLETFADISAIERDHGFRPSISIDEGIPRFVRWYRDYHGI